MRFIFVFPYNTWGGAFRSTYTLSNCLIAKGHKVTVVFPFFPLSNHLRKFSVAYGIYFVRGIFRSLIRYKRIPFPLNATVRFVPFLTSHFLPSADVIVANHWNTAGYVSRLPERCGRQFFYIRDIEQWADYFPYEIEAFRLPIEKIAVAKWIDDYLRRELEIEVKAVIENGTEWRRFAVAEKRKAGPLKVLMCYATHPMKDMETGVSVLGEVKNKFPWIEVVLFGFPFKPRLDFEFTYAYRPTGKRLSKLYADCQIFFCPSIQEGYHNPPREAMSAGCAVVATNVGCIPDVGRNLENMLVVEVSDKVAMVDSLSSLITDKDLRRRLGEQASEDIKMTSWEIITNRFLEVCK